MKISRNAAISWVISYIIAIVVIKYGWNYLADYFVFKQITFLHAIVIRFVIRSIIGKNNPWSDLYYQHQIDLIDKEAKNENN